MRQGFTLIEFAIVLVVIGLVLGGLLVGRDLIHYAELRRQMATVDEVAIALNTFRAKYHCIPGDCSDAEALGLGELAGNGDDLVAGYLDEYGTWINEARMFLLHLSLAELVPWAIDPLAPVQSWYAPGSILGAKQGFEYFEEVDTYWPGTLAPDGNGFWVLSGADTSGDAVIVEAFDRKYDDAAPLTGTIRVLWDELNTADPSSCIDPIGQYRTTGASTASCHVYIDMPY